MVQRRHEQRFGEEHAELAQALGAAIGWRNIYVPAEPGPVMPTTFGFSWIDVGPKTNDWRYIQFGWDNIFASYTAGVLGYKDAAYSNLIGIIMAKSNDGFVPNHAAGGALSTASEPVRSCFCPGSMRTTVCSVHFGEVKRRALLGVHPCCWLIAALAPNRARIVSSRRWAGRSCSTCIRGSAMSGSWSCCSTT